MDLIERTRKLENQKGVLIGLLYVSISTSIGSMADFFSGSLFAEIISTLIAATSGVVTLIGLWYALKSLKIT